MYTRILLLDDGSELSRRAVDHASYAASLEAGAVLVLRVSHAAGMQLADLETVEWDDLFAHDPNGGEHLEAFPPLSDVTNELAAAGVARVASLLVNSDDGDGPAIVTVAQGLGCDLIVMATHGETGLRRALLGSVADHVVQNAGIPVLLVR